jgi:hypothetical protein
METRSMNAQKYDIGKALVFAYSEDSAGDWTTAVANGFGEWNTAKNLFDDLVHLGTTEGPVEFEANGAWSDLVIEDTGPAIHKSYWEGENPTFSLGMFPHPDLIKAISPTGTASAGFELRPLANTMTMWIVPQQLFIEYTANVPSLVEVTYTGGVFLKEAGALTTEEQRLLDSSRLIWRARPDRLTERFSSEDGGKSLTNVDIAVLQDFEKPNGCQLYLHLSEIDDYEYELEFEPEVV